MDIARLFVSLPIEPAVGKAVFKAYEKLELPFENIKEVGKEQMHITLKFIGDQPIDKIPLFIEVLEGIRCSSDFIELQATKTLVFSEKSPKVLAIGFEENKLIEKLHSDIDQVLYDEGLVSKDVRRYKPHLTLGRIKKKTSYSQLTDFVEMPVNFSTESAYFQLQESQLSKTGPNYITLQTFNL